MVETSGSWGSHPVSAASFCKWELSTSACHTREISVFMERHIDQSQGRSTYDIFGFKGFTHSCIIYAQHESLIADSMSRVMSLHLRGVDQEADLLTTAQAMPPGHLTYWVQAQPVELQTIACASIHSIKVLCRNSRRLTNLADCKYIRFNLSGGTTAEFSDFNSYKALQHASKKRQALSFHYNQCHYQVPAQSKNEGICMYKII